MPRGVYKRKSRTPEHCTAISKAKKGVPIKPNSPEHNAAISKAKKGVPHTSEAQIAADDALSKANKGVPLSPEHCAAISKAHIGISKSPEHCAALSKAMKGVPRTTPAQLAAVDDQRGGNDLVNHHFIYDHDDLSKNIVQMTRSDHTSLHNLLRSLGYIVPHINVKEI